MNGISIMTKKIKEKSSGMLRSKVMWFNGILLAALPLFEMMQEVLPQIHEFLPDNVYRQVGLVVVLGNVLLRFFTDKPLEEK